MCENPTHKERRENLGVRVIGGEDIYTKEDIDERNRELESL